MKDNSLLKLEKKLESYSTKDILLSKFVLKPNIDKNEILQGRDLLKNIGNFVDNFKNQNNLILADEFKLKNLNIEEGAELAKTNSKKKVNKKINFKSKKIKLKDFSEESIKIDNDDNNYIEEKIKLIDKRMIEKTKEKKYIELNLKLGVLDLIKKENKNLIVDITEEKKTENEKLDKDKSDINYFKDIKNENKNTSNIKHDIKDNYLNILKRNDKILRSVISDKYSNNINENSSINEYPFLDLKNDAFNNEVFNFLLENAKNKDSDKDIMKKRRKLGIKNNLNK
jgi:hypothetical protein